MKLIWYLPYLSMATISVLGDKYHAKQKVPQTQAFVKEDASHWKNLDMIELEKTLNLVSNPNIKVAKNIIIFIGDGMSLSTVTAGRIYKAQYEGNLKGEKVSGEETLLSFEKFPHVALSKTYCVDAQTTDSAASASAIFSGIKTNIYTLGFDSTIVYQDVHSEQTASKVETILDWAQEAGKDTGIVTTARVAHATPAALYAHTADRDWECDKEMGDASKFSKDITWQLINSDPGRNLKVILGGGLSSFLPQNPSMEEAKRWNFTEDDWECRRLDGDNLIEQFLNKSLEVPAFSGNKGRFVDTRKDLMETNLNEVDYLLGLFSWDHMSYEYERELQNPIVEPSLSEMTQTAIQMLSKNEQGFFLMVEGAKIDMGHHDGTATVALHETMAFDKAIETALSMVNLDETLVIVTADHGHTLTMAGYPQRGADIRGLVTPENKVFDSDDAEDNKPYHILSYANGPGYYSNFGVQGGMVDRVDKSQDDFTTFGYLQPAGVPTEDETHSGVDVGIFATGPYSHLFHSVHEQSYIAYVMAYSACIGPFKDKCHSVTKTPNRVHAFS